MLYLCLRLNDAPVRGYEEDVGNKTTMRFFYPESAFSDPGLHNEPDTLMVLVPFKQQDLRWLKEILYNEKRVQNIHLTFPDPRRFFFIIIFFIPTASLSLVPCAL